MTDYLMIHPPGHGAWTWDGVKGAIEDNYRQRNQLNHARYSPGLVLTPDYGTEIPTKRHENEDSTTRVSMQEFCRFNLDDWVETLLDDACKADLRNPVIVGHSLAGLAALEVARRLPSPPRALVLIGAVVPDVFHNVLEMLPLPIRLLLAVNRLLPGSPPNAVKLHRELTLKLLCGDLDYPSASYILGRIRPIALQPLAGLPHPDFLNTVCPTTYVVLNRDRFVPAGLQRKMAASIQNTQVIQLDYGHEAPSLYPEQIANVVSNAELGYIDGD